MKPKFVVASVVIVACLAILAYTGFQDNKAYYQTVSEFRISQEAAYGRHLRIEGDVVKGSIVREAKQTKFVISHTDEKTRQTHTLPVRYIGADPLPDTFREFAQAVVEGEYHDDGVFIAKSMTAKCASKYEKEAAAGVVTAATKP